MNSKKKKKKPKFTKIFEKKSVSQSTQNALKRIEMQKKFFYPYDRLRAERRSAKPERRIGLIFWEDRRWDRT